jgi:hypothetical protein
MHANNDDQIDLSLFERELPIRFHYINNAVVRRRADGLSNTMCDEILAISGVSCHSQLLPSASSSTPLSSTILRTRAAVSLSKAANGGLTAGQIGGITFGVIVFAIVIVWSYYHNKSKKAERAAQQNTINSHQKLVQQEDMSNTEAK